MNADAPLWERIARIGRDALDEFAASDECKGLGNTLGPAVSGTRSVQRMVKALCNHIDDLERRLTETNVK